jgi:hypothetical protein
MSEKTVKNRGPGRPKLELDTEQLRKLAELQCNLKEIAYVMGCSIDTLRNNYQDVIDMGMAMGKVKLRRAMFRNATELNHAAVQIFLAKNMLGMSDNPSGGDDNLVLPWEDDPATE